jgi:ubiquinone/menaquinone biosynthesis C-methylase UbiE
MVELASSRAQREGIEVAFQEADAEELPFPDAIFDAVLSAFGAMFAPRPEVATAEMFRVLRPAGTLGMANWTPEGTIGRQTDLFQSYAPGGPPHANPLDWGRDDVVRERLSPYSDDIRLNRFRIREEYASWDEIRTHYETHLGPAIALRSVLEPERYDEMMHRLNNVYETHNVATDGGIAIEAEYLQVIARKAA